MGESNQLNALKWVQNSSFFKEYTWLEVYKFLYGKV